MNSAEQLQIREKVLEELKSLPDDKMGKIYDYIHHIRIELQNSGTNVDKIMVFAGCWSDMSDDVFSEFFQEMRDRREQAFTGRRKNETCVN